MKIFDGKKAADKILKDLAAAIKKEKLSPVLSVVLVGDNEASRLYVDLKKKAAAKIGIKIIEQQFSAQAKEEEIVDYIIKSNNDAQISGIIIQLPLPATLNTDRIIKAIDPKKDVDGFHPETKKMLEKNKAILKPVLPQVILAILQAAWKKGFAGKNIFALVNSEVFGQTLKSILAPAKAQVNYRVRNTCMVLGVEKEIKSADAIISVCGCPNMIKGEMIKDGAVLVDAGITRYHDGKVAGDIDKASVEAKAAFLTPVPGGVGPLTVALLLKNVYLAAKKE
ncbi:MAG TPA: bifunctional 5,10-methylenetetrahydrofolate dehydrogenase/5,10-methenyltetrahydrofolate cyclohydrolase [Candidatus Portnoybacteria bacterium]|nr:bifunctional 5,10-methylenetetrahydrofolate dehydrogenase/5,10-methenyltetrahydrofolate cyclohydrolase [Candidatus Portnoybacteria bacterium]